MVFSSLFFLYWFLPLVLIVYFLCRTMQAKNIALTLFSLFFYAWGEPVWVILLIFSAAVDYVNGLVIDKFRGKWQAKASITASLVINLGLLAVFKYSGFFMQTINGLTGLSLPVPQIGLPIGISFYTFQTLSYSIDVYRDQVKVQKSFLNFLLFVSLFPQLIAGPILRYSELQDQLSERKITWSGIFYGAMRFLCGLGKKVLIANYAGSAASRILDGPLSGLAVLGAWFGIIMFGFQIYFDFSGYSDMAIGLGRIFGFKYSENFNLPYTSKSVSEFWRRWHISLGSFFRDYVYIPMGGNRRLYLRNLFVVWFLTGLWHGASWNFVMWGLFFGVFIGIEKYTERIRGKLPAAAQLLITLFLVELSWMFFYFTDLTRLGEMLRASFGLLGNGFASTDIWMLLKNNLLLLAVCIIGSSPLPRTAGRIVIALYNENKQVALYRRLYLILASVYMAAVLVFCTASLVGASYNPFIYFRF